MQRFLVMLDRLDESVVDFAIVHATTADEAQMRMLDSVVVNASLAVNELRIHVEPFPDWLSDEWLRLSMALDKLGERARAKFLPVDGEFYRAAREERGW